MFKIERPKEMPGGRIELATNPECFRGCSTASNGKSLAADSSSPLTCVRSCELRLALRLPFSLQSRFCLRGALSSQYDHVNAVQNGQQYQQLSQCNVGRGNHEEYRSM